MLRDAFAQRPTRCCCPSCLAPVPSDTISAMRDPAHALRPQQDPRVSIAAAALSAFIPALPHSSWLSRPATQCHTRFISPSRRAPCRRAGRTTPRATAAAPSPGQGASPDEAATEEDNTTTTDAAETPASDAAEDSFANARAAVSASLNMAFDTVFNPVRAACPVLSSTWTSSYGNFILHPPASVTKPKAVLHFVGGAFFGAVPHQLYNTLLTRLCDRGHVVVATPYDLSFDYLPVADGIASRWEAVEADLAARYGPLPVVGVGHSAGAMLHALTASLFDDAAPKAANILISFNCRPARAAIPAYDTLAPAARAAVAAEAALPPNVRASLRDLPARLDAVLRDGAFTPHALRDEVLPVAQQARRFAEQVWPVLRELAGEPRTDDVARDGASGAEDKEGGSRVDEAAEAVGSAERGGAENRGGGSGDTRDFYPSPDEIAGAVERLYPVGETLVVKFRDDALDDSAKLADMLTRNANATFSVVELDGSHLTPLAQDAPDVGAAAAAVGGGPLADGLGVAASGVLGEVAGALGLRQLQALESCIDEWVESAIANGKL